MSRYLTAFLLLAVHQTYAFDVIAHRGYACAADDNSLASVARAWHIGADGVEVDVRVSRDGVVFLFHDDEISEQRIDDLTFFEINSLNVAPIPTLAELLVHSRPEGYYVFDLKVSKPLQIENVVKIIEQAEIDRRSISFQSGDLDVLANVRKHLPDVQLSYLTPLKWKVPYLLHPNATELVSTLNQLDIDRISIKGRSFVDRQFIDTLQSTGREVHVWTINGLDRAIHYRNLGVDGLITDNVEGILNERSASKSQENECPRTPNSEFL